LSELDLLLSVALGVGLAAAVGFRVFVPLLVLAVAAAFGSLELAEPLAWLATPQAIAVLAVAALVELLAYYIPGLDNLLDALAAPAAIVAGTLASAAVLTDLPPIVKWTTAIIAGGGTAGLLQSVTGAVRLHSTAMTGGLGNFVLSTGELVGSLGLALLALAAPLVALAIVVLFCWMALRIVRRLLRRTSPARTDRRSARRAPPPSELSR
jgi:hypothetical protein